jgi:hypothetical protein
MERLHLDIQISFGHGDMQPFGFHHFHVLGPLVDEPHVMARASHVGSHAAADCTGT